MTQETAACAECVDLRRRLVNIYHLTLNGGDLASTVRAIRAASGPGAPAPARVERCIACAASAPLMEESNA